MTVRELKEKLQEYNEDANIEIYTNKRNLGQHFHFIFGFVNGTKKDIASTALLHILENE